MSKSEIQTPDTLTLIQESLNLLDQSIYKAEAAWRAEPGRTITRDRLDCVLEDLYAARNRSQNCYQNLCRDAEPIDELAYENLSHELQLEADCLENPFWPKISGHDFIRVLFTLALPGYHTLWPKFQAVIEEKRAEFIDEIPAESVVHASGYCVNCNEYHNNNENHCPNSK